MLVSYNWLGSYFKEKLPVPEETAEALSLHALEVEGLEKIGDDWVIDVDVLPNRAHDLLSHFGISKELSVLLNLQLTINNQQQFKVGRGEPSLEVEVEDKEKCRRYIGVEMNNIKVGPSPGWLKNRLETVGQRSINNIVDATNYVMLSTGQPLHAFDADKLQSKKIVIRNAKKGEKIITLDGEEKKLDDSILVIADEKDALAIAGVKGGTKAEIDENTKNIILESANFNPVSIRRTAQSLGIQTDSSKRFENEITPEMAEWGMNEVIKLLFEIAKTPETEVMKSVDVYSNPVKPWNVSVSVDEVNKVLGMNISKDEIKSIFSRFEFEFTEKGGKFDVKIPNYRLDLKIKEDLIEEIGRVYGYANIDSVLPEPAQPEINKEFYYTTKIRNILTEQDFSEVYTYSFVEKGEIEIQNPLASDKKFLRVNLVDGIAEALERNAKNVPLFGLDTVKIFEIGTIFTEGGPKGEPGLEHIVLAIGVKNTEKKDTKESEKIKQIIDYLFEQLGLSIRHDVFTDINESIMQISLGWLLKQLPDPTSYDDLNLEMSKKEITYRPSSIYPFVLRDIAVWTPQEVESYQVYKVIKSNAGELLVTEPKLFDTFNKEGKTSYAYRLVFQSHEKTLSDKEVNVIMEKITTQIEKNKGWGVR